MRTKCVLIAGIAFSCAALSVWSVEGIVKADEIDQHLRTKVNFNYGWKFLRRDKQDAHQLTFNDNKWHKVSLPHTPRIEPLVVNDQWQGICWYRKRFKVDNAHKGRKLFLDFGAAMQVADVWLNGRHIKTHHGGYLPFTIDITKQVKYGGDNLISIRLDNRDNPDVPPGKPLKKLDFCMYGGLYRNVNMRITDKLHITNAVYADKVGGGGVFITSSNVSDDSAVVQIKTHVINEHARSKRCKVMSLLINHEGQPVNTEVWKHVELASGADHHFVRQITIDNPGLWHPHHPYLYTVHTIVADESGPVDSVETRIGIRHISFGASDGFRINGRRMYLRGTNHHQEYPYIGYALSDNAQYRDARKIKDAGFDYIRLSHYPHSPAFMDACDELGLVVMNCIPGWQFMGEKTFREISLQNCRDIIRRDRNHPCVILWEVSLNETKMDDEFILQTHRIAHEEYPGEQCYTCGWVDDQYDVFIQARQHGGCHNYKNADKACVISEYGDWEYYSQNAGLDQPGFKNLKKEERNSRQLRGFGQKRLLQQAMNFQEALNDNLSTPAVGDGLWVMFDYNRGYHDSIESSGPMDIFRLPKFSYYFFQSQRDSDTVLTNAQSGPMVHIASYWKKDSPRRVRVFSNCPEVALYLNGQLIEKRQPDKNRFSDRLQHAPFIFTLKKLDVTAKNPINGAKTAPALQNRGEQKAFDAGVKFSPGVLRAVGLIDGKERVSHEVRTPDSPKKLAIRFDTSSRNLKADGVDTIFVHASVVDVSGTVVPDDSRPITFEVSGPGRLIGSNPIQAEAGIATVLLRSETKAGSIIIKTSAQGVESAQAVISSHP